MSSQLSLRLRKNNSWHVSKTAFEQIDAYLQPDSTTSASDAASSLDSLTPIRRSLSEGEKAESESSFFLNFWETFIEIARQVPYQSPAQDRLFELIQELHRLPTSSSEVWTPAIWAPIQAELENTLRDQWGAPSPKEDTYEPFSEWINLNSFVARLYNAGLIHQKLFPFETLRLSLERRQPPSKDLIECSILAAAQWIEHAASQILAVFLATDTALGMTERQEISSAQFGVEDGKLLSMDRWTFWKAKFQEYADHGIVPSFREHAEQELSESVKAAAGKAAQIMDEVEGS